MMDIYQVIISKKALKELKKVPGYILDKFQSWVETVELEGLSKVKLLPSFHDELLKGKRLGQRSIRLSRAYRAIYTIKTDSVEFVLVEEVNKHDY